jgi:hypothetical protein
MRSLLSATGRAFLRVFVGALVVFAPGVLAAPDLQAMRSLGLAALLASTAAGIRAVQVFVPQLSVRHWIVDPYGEWADSYLHGFLSSLLITLPGALEAPDLAAVRALLTAAIVGAAAAGARALQGTLTVGERPAPRLGLKDPPGTA